MPFTKHIVCLANSRKLNGRCVAGIEIVHGQRGGWVRPVSHREHQEVSENERQYEDGSDPDVLDIIDVPLQGHLPQHYQQENWRIDPQFYWVKRGSFAWSDLYGLVDPPGPLWIDGHSTFNGQNDLIPQQIAEAQITSSLRLIFVERLELRVFAPSEAFGNNKRRVLAMFDHHGAHYRFWVTDPAIERLYLAREDGTHQLGKTFLTISLGEPFRDAVNKLVAAVIPQAGRRGP